MVGPDDTWGNFGGGIAAEIALDPLTYLTFGGSALSKAGQAAKGIGLTDDLAKVAARKLNKPLGDVGKREARLSTNLSDFATQGGDAGLKAQSLIDQGIDAAQPLGGLVGVGLPFMEPAMVLGTGRTAQSAAKAMDAAGKAIQYAKIPGTDIAPINSAYRLFDVSLGNASTPLGQEVAKEHYRGKQSIDSSIRGQMASFANDLDEADALGRDAGDLKREYLEGNAFANELDPTSRRIADTMKADIDAMPAIADEWGLDMRKFQDDFIEYFPRRVSEKPGAGSQSTSLKLDAVDRENKVRRDFLKGIPGGTNSINVIAQDPGIQSILDGGGTSSDVATYLKGRHEAWLPDEYKTIDQAGNEAITPGRYESLGAWLSSLDPEIRESGPFGNHPAIDYRTRKIGFETALNGVKALHLALSQPGVLKPASEAAEGSVRLGDLLSHARLKLGDGSKGFGRKLLESNPSLKFDELADMRLSTDHARDLVGLMKATTPKATSDFIRTIDNITNLSKSLWTGVWPAFHFRNLISGSVHNFALGQFDAKSAIDAHKMLLGGVVTGAKDIPAIKREWAKRSDGRELTDEYATKILGEMAYSQGIIDRSSTNYNDVTGAVHQPTGTLEDILFETLRPGEKKVSATRTAKKALGIHPETSWKPWEVRGVGGRDTSKFAPSAAVKKWDSTSRD